MKGRTFKGIKGGFQKILLLAALLIAAVSADPASATPLTTPTKPFPDITASFISTSYNAGAQLFQAGGFGSAYVTSTLETPDISAYGFHLVANIDNQGKASVGYLDIFSSFDVLLTGSLVKIGYDQNDPTMQFLFDVTGGSAAPDFGSQAFVTLSYSGFDSGFGSDWSNWGGGMADINAPAVPEPGTVSLLLLGGGGMLLYRRRKSANNA